MTVEPASTEKLAADPKPTVAVAPRALLAKRRVDRDPSRRSPTRKVLRPARRAERRLAARESLEGDSYFDGTPLFIGVSSLRRQSAAIEGEWLPGLFDLLCKPTVHSVNVSQACTTGHISSTI
ncbi:MAG TPA: hypothetical protein VG147_03545 [Solirubrobacteraceae bacterium]|nr:hypothetical protein [Solirubrobacteraceae bacterium]